MAVSRYAYVKDFELPDPLHPTTFLLLRIDGKGFHNFSRKYNFEKPNDKRALDLMNEAAKRVMNGKELNKEIVLAFGESDEFSFLFRKSCKLYGRRNSKIITLVVSLFTTAYTFLWPQYFPDTPLSLNDLPVFDGRIVQYTTEQQIQDYFRWRQADAHINNLYNTCFWALVLEGNLSERDAHQRLSGTVSSEKQEILFTQFNINYNNIETFYRKGSILVWESIQQTKKTQVVIKHEDLISETWWSTGPGHSVLS